MKRLSPLQRQRIVHLFQSGTTMHCLAETWEISVEKVEHIIREALKQSVPEETL